MSYPEAAAMGLTYMTAHFALVERARIKVREVVLVTGAAEGRRTCHGAGYKSARCNRARRGEHSVKAAAAQASGADHIIDTGV